MLPLAIVSDAAMIDHKPGSLRSGPITSVARCSSTSTSIDECQGADAAVLNEALA